MVARSTPETFWRRIRKGRKSGCWPFNGHTDYLGYGKVMYQGEPWLAHRLAHVLAVGPIPDGMCVCHHCDNPACCNPAHFFIGDRADNNRDRHAKGRSSGGRHVGENNPCARLTWRQVYEMRRLCKEGVSIAEIAEQYPVERSTVRDIVAGKTWRTSEASKRRGHI